MRQPGSPGRARVPTALQNCRISGGGGGEHSWHASFWIYPLPPGGPVTLVVSWPEQGIPETRGELDGTAIRAAAQRAVVLWPDEPDLESEGTWQTIIAEASDEGPP